MFPEVVDDAVGHGEHDVVFLDSEGVQHGDFVRRVRAVCAELARAVEPVPLLFCAEEDFAGRGPDDEDLAVAELGDVEEGVGGCLVGGEERAAGGGGAVPFVVGGRGGGLRFFEGGLQVGDGCGWGGRGPGGGFDFEGPEMEDQTGPETAGDLLVRKSICVCVCVCVYVGDVRSVSALPRRPRAHAVIRADEVIADQHGVVAVGDAADHLAIHPRPPVAALVVGAQRLGEAGGREAEEGRREGATRPLCVQRIARLEVEGRLGRRRRRVIGHWGGGA